MAPRALDSHYDFEPHDHFSSEPFELGERMCPPPSRNRGGTMLQSLVVIAVIFGGGWLALYNREALDAVLSPVTSAISAAMEPRNVARQAEPVADQLPAAPAPIASREIVAAPGVETGTEIANAQAPSDGLTSPVATEDDGQAAAEAPPQPLPPLNVDPADPYQERAMAVGLHPELSPALLSRLTADDYKNAGYAIKTALAETPERGVFKWPRKAGARQAHFEVRFVASASADCRRYVVIVTKDRWSTTAPAMETCGADLPGKGTKATSAG